MNLLKIEEENYKKPTMSILNKIEKHIYDLLTIEEIENIKAVK